MMIKWVGKRKKQEIQKFTDYVEKLFEGESVEAPALELPVHKKLAGYFECLLKSDKTLSNTAKELLITTTELSKFDVETSYLSKRLRKLGENISVLSESNLAIVEQTTASMHSVNEVVEEATAHFKGLTLSAKETMDKNHVSLNQVAVIDDLRSQVILSSEKMNSSISDLITLAEDVTKIVGTVENIANQTNLLALNASIEAARAGENGRGFSVVAEEIRKLSEETSMSLDSMKSIMNEIKHSAGQGRKNMESTLGHTNEMSEKIDLVHGTIEDNVQMMSNMFGEIDSVALELEDVKQLFSEVNKAMESSAKDAESLSQMAVEIQEDAQESEEISSEVSDIDNQLSLIVKEQMKVVNQNVFSYKKGEIIQDLTKAINAHRHWVDNLEDMVSKMETKPLQTNSSKCAFGHFYNSIGITHPEIKPTWEKIDVYHKRLHDKGHIVLSEIDLGNRENANTLFRDVKEISQKVIDSMEFVKEKIDEDSIKENRLFS